MGLFDKIKNLFLEEEEVETKPKMEARKEITPPIKKIDKHVEVKKDVSDVISERELFKSETTFKFPVMFEEEDLEKEKEKQRHTNILDVEKTKIKNKVEEPEKKVFKPTPVISPIYGIIDKEYRKSQMLEEKKKQINNTKTKENTGSLSVDDVRKKAYGTLEDDIENTLSDNDSMFYNLKDEEVEEKEAEGIKENTDLLEDLTEEIVIEDVTLEEADTNYKELNISYDSEKDKPDINKIGEANNKDIDKDNLFNLIDSMYESEGEENDEDSNN
ncbi:MAG: hypothetical protein WDA21_01310 [Bacilli bacterium]